MIDAQETVLEYLKDDATLPSLVGARITSKHLYGDDWDTDDAALIVRLDGGEPQWYGPIQVVRFEVDAYAPDQPAAYAIWRRVQDICKATQGVKVVVTGGTALLHTLLVASCPSLVYDSVVGMDVCLGFLVARVSEDTL